MPKKIYLGDSPIGTSILSRHIRTSWRLFAKSPLKFPEFTASIRFFAQKEADELAELVRRKNPFARQGGSWNFYFQRIQCLGNQTVVEIFRRGHPDAIAPSVDRLSNVIETIVLLSSCISMSRTQFQKHLGITSHRRRGFDVTIGPNFYTLRSKANPERPASGLPIDISFSNRFERLGFRALIQYCLSDSDLSQRVSSTLYWLLESRQEPALSAAIVKTAIALESLLVFKDTEPLARSLSERCAFLLSPEPSTRSLVSRLVRDFYDSRSSVVHGSRRKSESISTYMLEAIDRLTLFLCLILASNQGKWNSKDSLREWCEQQKWDGPDRTVKIPFSKRYCHNALKLAASS